MFMFLFPEIDKRPTTTYKKFIWDNKNMMVMHRPVTFFFLQKQQYGTD